MPTRGWMLFLSSAVDAAPELGVLTGDDDPIQIVAGADHHLARRIDLRRARRVEQIGVEVRQDIVRVVNRGIQGISHSVLERDVGPHAPGILREELIALLPHACVDFDRRLRVVTVRAARAVAIAAQKVLEGGEAAAGSKLNVPCVPLPEISFFCSNARSIPIL